MGNQKRDSRQVLAKVNDDPENEGEGSRSAAIDKRHFVYDAKLGAVFIVWDTRISFTHVFRSREYEGQPKPDQFGSVAVNFAF